MTPAEARKKWLEAVGYLERVAGELRAYAQSGEPVRYAAELPDPPRRQGAANPKTPGAFAKAGEGVLHPAQSKPQVENPAKMPTTPQPPQFQNKPKKPQAPPGAQPPEPQAEQPPAPPQPGQLKQHLESGQADVSRLLASGEFPWRQATAADHVALQSHFKAMPPQSFWATAMNAAHGMDDDAKSPHAEHARAVLHRAAANQQPGPYVALTGENRGNAIRVSTEGMDPQKASAAQRILDSLPKVKGEPDAYYVPAGFDVSRFLGPDYPVAVGHIDDKPPMVEVLEDAEKEYDFEPRPVGGETAQPQLPTSMPFKDDDELPWVLPADRDELPPPQVEPEQPLGRPAEVLREPSNIRPSVISRLLRNDSDWARASRDDFEAMENALEKLNPAQLWTVAVGNEQSNRAYSFLRRRLSEMPAGPEVLLTPDSASRAVRINIDSLSPVDYRAIMSLPRVAGERDAFFVPDGMNLNRFFRGEVSARPFVQGSPEGDPLRPADGGAPWVQEIPVGVHRPPAQRSPESATARPPVTFESIMKADGEAEKLHAEMMRNGESLVRKNADGTFTSFLPPESRQWKPGDMEFRTPEGPRMSGAKVDRFSNSHMAAEFNKKVFGSDDLRWPTTVAAVPDDASNVSVSYHTNGRGVSISYFHPAIDGMAGRTIKIDPVSGKGFIHNDILRVKLEHREGSFVFNMFAQQVQNATAHGFSHIECFAAKSAGKDGFTGYRVWPWYGYDQRIEKLELEVGDRTAKRVIRDLHKAFPDAETLIDVYNETGGYEFWKKRGHGVHNMVFDLSPDSKSRKRLAKQWQKKSQAKK